MRRGFKSCNRIRAIGTCQKPASASAAKACSPDASARAIKGWKTRRANAAKRKKASRKKK